VTSKMCGLPSGNLTYVAIDNFPFIDDLYTYYKTMISIAVNYLRLSSEYSQLFEGSLFTLQ